MNRAIIFDASSISNVSGQILVAPNECVLIRAYNLAPGEQLTVEQLALTVGQIGSSSGICNGPAAPSSGAAVLATSPYSPCGAQAGPTPDASSFVLQQPGYYQLTLPPPALGTAVVEAWFLEGEDACEQAANQCCCDPLSCATLQSFFPDAGRQLDPSDLILVRSGARECLAVTPRDLCADLQAFPALPTPGLTDRLVVLSGGQCFVSTIDEVFSEAVVCDSLLEFGAATLPLQPTDQIVVIQAGDCNRATLAQLFQQTDGSCALPAYSFATDPTSGMFYDPASPVLCGAGPAVVIGFNNCASRLDVGDSIRLTALNGDFLEVGCSITARAVIGDVDITAAVGAAALLAPLGEARILGRSGAKAIFDGDIDITAPLGGVSLGASPAGGAGVSMSSSGDVRMQTASTSRLHIRLTGEWEIPTGSPGIAGEVITSQGGGLPPIWAAASATVAFPLLAPSGSCLAPSYSFTASPDSGMFYDPAGVGSVVIGDDNCADFISVGASVNIVSSASTVTVDGSGSTVTVSGTFIQLLGFTGSPSGAPVSLIGGSGSGAGDFGGNVGMSGGNSPDTLAGNASLSAGSSGTAQGAQINVFGATTNLAPGGMELVTGFAPASLARGDIRLNSRRLSIETGGAVTALRLRLDESGAWLLPVTAGTAGQVITSGGPGVSPTWAAASATVTFPLLAPTNDTPQYSFAAAPAAGMAFSSTEVKFGIFNTLWTNSAGLRFSAAATGGLDVFLEARDKDVTTGVRAGDLYLRSGSAIAPSTDFAGTLRILGGDASDNPAGNIQIFGGTCTAAPGSGSQGGDIDIRAGNAPGIPGDVRIQSGLSVDPGITGGGNITIFTPTGFLAGAPVIKIEMDNNAMLSFQHVPGNASQINGQLGTAASPTGQQLIIRGGNGTTGGGDGGALELRGGGPAGGGVRAGGNLGLTGTAGSGGGVSGYVQAQRVTAAPVVAPNVIASHTPFVFVDDGALRLFGWRQSSGTWVSVTLT